MLSLNSSAVLLTNVEVNAATAKYTEEDLLDWNVKYVFPSAKGTLKTEAPDRKLHLTVKKN